VHHFQGPTSPDSFGDGMKLDACIPMLDIEGDECFD
jgi:hypothetical protein